MNHNLSEKWIKASIAGTIWAASEIVLGSFLHNLKVPFSGNILTAIGIIILISVSYIWRDKGLFWRAGLICAIMKTMSPSAVIFGPMIAIFAESVLLEISVRLLGRTIPGYILGAMLAMSWNLFHKIISYIVYYGSNIIDVYTNLLKMAQRQLSIQTDIVWLPIIILLVVYALFGLAAGIIGIRVGRRMLHQPAEAVPLRGGENIPGGIQKNRDDFGYSVSWLMLNVLLIIGSFLLLAYTEWYIWAPAITGIVALWVMRYRRAMRQLSKPKFWILFIVITLITAFAFTAGGEGNFWRNGLLTGISMNFRAFVIIFGFSALGTELYNPVVRNFFSRTAFRNLPLAVELSVESLPDFIAAIPDFKSFRKNPVSVFYQVLSHAGNRLSEIQGRNRRIFIITGGKAEGKTTFAGKVAAFLKEHRLKPAGFLAERIMKGEETTGYDLVNVETGERINILTSGDDIKAAGRIGKFTISMAGFAYGEKILHQQIHHRRRLVFIDEVGALELRGQGWSASMDQLLEKSHNNIVLVVRDEFLDKVKERWNLKDAVEFNIRLLNYVDAGNTICNL